MNGLAVMELGDSRFATPARITATVRLGSGEVIDIERETELGGAIHSKGVFILSSFLGERYAQNRPLSLSASLVFEQSYGMIEGDSASMAELCCLLSSLSEIPIKQNIAMTGSVNQRGEAQAIGGVNEKIEGFFDICRARELTAEQAVLIPASNVKHLMLRNEIVDACREGKFAVYAYSTVDEAMELLTGKTAKEINTKVEARLIMLEEIHQEYAKAAKESGEENE
jgi:predicted ATP-dependent protease